MNKATGVMLGDDLGALAENVKERAYRDLYFAATAIWGYTFLDARFHQKLAAQWEMELRGTLELPSRHAHSPGRARSQPIPPKGSML